ncbi:MAG: superoxide dismutase [Halothece sp.]
MVGKKICNVLVILSVIVLLVACGDVAQVQAPSRQVIPETERTEVPSSLPELPYAYDALEPHIDAETMRLHHDRHHAAYVNNLNEALTDYPDLQENSVEELLQNLNTVPEEIRRTVRNNGGGHVNHSLFWSIMSPDGGGAATGALADEINNTFGSFESFKEQFNEAGSNIFGSGWVWLVRNPAGELEIMTTPNQDSPLMEEAYPLMGNDVWEHAYYLNYRNQRGEYLTDWWNVVNWDEVNRRSQLYTN